MTLAGPIWFTTLSIIFRWQKPTYARLETGVPDLRSDPELVKHMICTGRLTNHRPQQLGANAKHKTGRCEKL